MIEDIQALVPVAIVRGEIYTALPQDLYIPPDALEIFLETFSGPLDLLLYLIKKQNLDILDIPIAEITRQYQQYIELMQVLKLELAAEYLLMGAMLADIKSRLLLPKPTLTTEDEDPRAELIRRLREYEQLKVVAEQLDNLPRVERDIWLVSVAGLEFENRVKPLPDIQLEELCQVLNEVLTRANFRVPYLIQREVLSVRERMTCILEQLSGQTLISFQTLLDLKEGRLGVVVTLSALLELAKQSAILVHQEEPFTPIQLQVR
ncbi:MAG: ScpA family protein [Gammaproteobacteria bacterium]